MRKHGSSRGIAVLVADCRWAFARRPAWMVSMMTAHHKPSLCSRRCHRTTLCTWGPPPPGSSARKKLLAVLGRASQPQHHRPEPLPPKFALIGLQSRSYLDVDFYPRAFSLRSSCPSKSRCPHTIFVGAGATSGVAVCVSGWCGTWLVARPRHGAESRRVTENSLAHALG